MTKSKMTAMIAAALTLSVSASAQNMGMKDAYVRVVHAVSDAPAVDVYVDGTRTVSNAPFKAVTAYGEVPAGMHKVMITAAGNMKAVVFSGSVNLKAGVYYTVAASGYLKKVTPIIFYTSGLNKNKGKAEITVYHLAPDAPAVQAIAVDMNKAGLFKTPLKYGYDRTLLVNPMGVNLDIVPFGKMSPVVKNISGISVAGGKTYSLFAVGTLKNKNFDVIVAEDKLEMGSMGKK
ncbi:DUF4397 domain-containing protein [Deinococcus psychrotolerans]|nr:DUF4397 domain-containing protein [Deinococcus psychrotolerans]